MNQTATPENALLRANLEALSQTEPGDKGYTNLGGSCSKCGAQNIGCLWCVEWNNSCVCTTSHSCN